MLCNAAVLVERPKVAPVLQAAPYVPGTGRNGGVQGLDWHNKALRQDTDGIWADAFIDADPSGSRPKQAQ